MKFYNEETKEVEQLGEHEFSINKHVGDSGAKNIKFETPEDLMEFFAGCPDHKAYIDEELYRKIKLFNMPIGENLKVASAGSGIVRVEWNGK